MDLFKRNMAYQTDKMQNIDFFNGLEPEEIIGYGGALTFVFISRETSQRQVGNYLSIFTIFT